MAKPVPADDLPSSGSAVPDDDLPGAAPAPVTRRRGAFETANDLVIEAGNAVAGAVKSVSDFVVPGNRVGQFIDENIIKPGEAKQSDVVKSVKQRFQQDVAQADGIGGELAAVGRYALDAPGLVAAQAAGSFALPAGAVKTGGIIGARLGLGTTTAGLAGGAAAGAALSGGDAGGNAYDLVMKADEAKLRQAPEWGALEAAGMAPNQIREELATRAARAGSVVPALIGGVAGTMGAEKLLAGAGKATGRLATAAKAAVSEGLQEGVEEGVTQYSGQKAAQAYDSSIDAGKGVAAAAGMGAVMGAGTGGAVGLIQGGRTPVQDNPNTSVDERAVLEQQVAKVEKAVELLRGPDPAQVISAVQSAGTIDEAIAAATAITDEAGPLSQAFNERQQLSTLERESRQGTPGLEPGQAQVLQQGPQFAEDAPSQFEAKRAAARAAVEQELGLPPLTAAEAAAGPRGTAPTAQPAGTPDLKPGEARVLSRSPSFENLTPRANPAVPQAPGAPAADNKLPPAQAQQLARQRAQAQVDRPLANPVAEAQGRVQTAPATSQADVQRLAAQSEQEVLQRWENEYRTRDTNDRQTAANRAAAEQAQAAATAQASAMESGDLKVQQVAAAERQRAVDQLTEALAEQVQYGSTATVTKINQRLIALKMAPLSKTERGRVVRLVDAARSFAIQPPQAPKVIPDRNADNAPLEAQIAERRPPPGPAPRPAPAAKALQRQLDRMDRRGPTDGVIPEMARDVQAQPGTTERDVLDLAERAQETGLDRALQRGGQPSPVAEAAGRVQTAPATTTSDVRRMAQDARGPREEAAAEEIDNAIAALDQTQRLRTISDMVERIAPTTQYGTVATLQRMALQMERAGLGALTKDERARVVRVIEAARKFTEVRSTPDGVPIEPDRNADNSSMEALIPQRIRRSDQREDAPETPPYKHSESRVVESRALPAEAEDGELSQLQYRFIYALGRMFGKKVEVFESSRDDAPDGYVLSSDSKTIYINRRSGQAHLVVFGHELLHQVKAEMPAAYDAILQTIKLRDNADLNRVGLNNDMEEVTADLVGNLFADPGFWVDVMGRLTQPQAKSLGELIGGVVARFKKALGGMRGFDTGDLVTNLDDVRQATTQALATYLQNDLNENTSAGRVAESGESSTRLKQSTSRSTDDQRQEARAQGDRAGRDQGRSLAPLEGAPTVAGASGPDPRLVEVAERYARGIGVDLRRQAKYVEVDPQRAARIAQAYADMPHAPQDPRVKEAYQNLIDQTLAQYEALADAGYQFYLIDESNDPYAGNPWNAMRDLRANQQMGVFATEAGFGSGATDLNVEDNPLLADTGLEWGYGSPDGPKKRVLANDLFRAVHDAFGHGLEGAGFRAQGEENAWQAHARLFTGSALGAITTETRGQNSWLNYGPYGEQNRTAKVEDTVFADQKTGLMPEWTWTEGRVGDDLTASAKRPQSQARQDSEAIVELRKQQSVLRSVLECLSR